MATWSNDHASPNNSDDPREFGAAPVSPCQVVLTGSPIGGSSQEQQRSLRCSASTRQSKPIAAGLLFVIVGALIAVTATFAISNLRAPIRGHASTAPRASPSARPNYLNDWTAGAISQPTPQGTDLEGFVGYPDARCKSGNPAVAIGRTSRSLIVVRQNYAAGFYYKGFGLKEGRSVELDDLERGDDNFTTTTNGALYLVSSAALIVARESNIVVDEPMLEYWSV